MILFFYQMAGFIIIVFIEGSVVVFIDGLHGTAEAGFFPVGAFPVIGGEPGFGRLGAAKQALVHRKRGDAGAGFQGNGSGTDIGRPVVGHHNLKHVAAGPGGRFYRAPGSR